MKYLTLLFILLIVCSNIFASQKDHNKQVILRGGGLSITTNIQVNIENNTVITTFLKDTPNTTVTVKKKTGGVIQTENLNAKTFDQVPMKVENYQKGKYIIEIQTKEGKAEGEF